MKPLSCQKCNKNMGEMELGKIRNGAVILCKECWEMAEAAIQMAELVRNQNGGWGSKDTDMPDFFKGIFK